MSSTNRGRKRIKADFYPTPRSSFRVIIPFLNPKLVHWECASGDGRLVNMMLRAGISAAGDDLRHGYDFLQDDKQHQAIVTNPPYSKAQEFITHALNHAQEVWMLLRLNFLASKKRRQWWRQHRPHALFILAKRPSFVHGGTDSCDYAWFYWGMGRRPGHPRGFNFV